MKKGISRRAKQLRKKLNLTQTELGKQIGISGSTVSSYEIGDSLPSIETCIKLCQLTGASLDWLLLNDDGSRLHLRQLPDDENRLLEIYRTMNSTAQSALLKLLESQLKQ